ncbi:MAG: ankyrin repeat domain-containing protein [Pseudomonadota bacterium]
MIKPLTGATNDFLKIVMPACASGKLEAVKVYLQDEREFARWIGPHGRTMLWEAARKGRLDIVKLLAEKYHADKHAIGCYYRETRLELSPWLIATINKKLDVAEYLSLQGAGLDFHSACFLGNAEFIGRILANNPKVANEPYVREHRWNGYTVWPLQYAVVGRQIAVVKQLLEAGANANESPQILFDAVGTSQLDMAEVLLAAGADPRATKQREWLIDPVFNALARRYGHDIETADVPTEKWPGLVDACRGNHNMPDDPDRVLPFLERGDNVNVRDYKQKTPLHRASQAGFLKITELLLKHGADIEAKSKGGDTPLFDAAFYGRAEQVELLIKLGANPNALNDVGETPLFAAVRSGNGETVFRLHTLGAGINIENKKGKCAEDFAKRSRKKGIETVRQAFEDIHAQESGGEG